MLCKEYKNLETEECESEMCIDLSLHMNCITKSDVMKKMHMLKLQFQRGLSALMTSQEFGH